MDRLKKVWRWATETPLINDDSRVFYLVLGFVVGAVCFALMTQALWHFLY